MAEFILKYADPSGEIHSKVAEGASEQEVRDRLSQQGFLIYSIRPRGGEDPGLAASRKTGGKKIDLEKFLIFNQQFVTLIQGGTADPKGARPAGRPTRRSETRTVHQHRAR